MTEILKRWITSLAREEKAEVLAEIVKRCKVSPYTVQAWLRGSRTPSPLAQQELIKYLKRKGVEV